jgi:hypothetical protein
LFLSYPSLLFVCTIRCVHLGFGLGLFGPACFVVHMHTFYLLTRLHCQLPTYYNYLLLVVALLASSSSSTSSSSHSIRAYVLLAVDTSHITINTLRTLFFSSSRASTHAHLLVTSLHFVHIHTSYTTLPSHYRGASFRAS